MTGLYADLLEKKNAKVPPGATISAPPVMYTFKAKTEDEKRNDKKAPNGIATIPR